MSHPCKRKDIIFIKSQLDVKFANEESYQDDILNDEELITASQQGEEEIAAVEEKRVQQVNQLIEANKKPVSNSPKTKRTIKR